MPQICVFEDDCWMFMLDNNNGIAVELSNEDLAVVREAERLHGLAQEILTRAVAVAKARQWHMPTVTYAGRRFSGCDWDD